MSRSLYLIGPRGAGKSTSGRLLAKRVGATFFDADNEVESRAGYPIQDMFARDGEPAFRALERVVMLELLGRDSCVVATGGGCVLDDEVRARLRDTRAAFWLQGTVPALQRRIAGSRRPSLTGRPLVDEVERIVTERQPLYEECAAGRVDTSTRTKHEVVDVLERFWTALQDHDVR